MTLEIIYFLVFQSKALKSEVFSSRCKRSSSISKKTNRGPGLITEEAGGAGAILFPGPLRTSTEAWSSVKVIKYFHNFVPASQSKPHGTAYTHTHTPQ